MHGFKLQQQATTSDSSASSSSHPPCVRGKGMTTHTEQRSRRASKPSCCCMSLTQSDQHATRQKSGEKLQVPSVEPNGANAFLGHLGTSQP
eukprot:3582990-Amphidinium_carterae.3